MGPPNQPLHPDALPFGRLWYGTQSAMRNLFRFLGLGLRVYSPYRHCRGCGSRQPGKKKQKRYDYGCAVLIVHRFPFFAHTSSA